MPTQNRNSPQAQQDPAIYKAIESCRLCGSAGLTPVIDLGIIALTGVFPRDPATDVPSGPLSLLKCDACHLVQLAHNYRPALLYGKTYGYRSGLNESMVSHLQSLVGTITQRIALQPGNWVIDIGSNDGTTLGAYYVPGLNRLGIDPSAGKFRKYYQPDILILEDFFTAAGARKIMGSSKAKVISSIAMFYDLENPLAFARDVVDMLADDGIWVLEQSYLPAMLKAVSYDSICHEHLEYYGLTQIKYIADKLALKIIDVSLNDVNGGSFVVTMAKQATKWPEVAFKVLALLREEQALGLHTTAPFIQFSQHIDTQKQALLALLEQLKQEGKTVFGYGASTKGNVLLQYCGIDSRLLPCIAEVNSDKYGAFTPGTRIPILSEAEAKARKPDYFLVLPWHFRTNIVEREQSFLKQGGKLIFPMPQLDIVAGT